MACTECIEDKVLCDRHSGDLDLDIFYLEIYADIYKKKGNLFERK